MRSLAGLLSLSLLLQLTIAQKQFQLRSSDNGSVSQDPSARCKALLSNTGFENTTITNATYYSEFSPTDGIPDSPCTLETPPTNITVPLCRVAFVVNTTDTSQVKAEMWLPDEWYGRFLAVGNGGLNGCIDYTTLQYGTNLHFATVAGNNGHDGSSGDGEPFFNHPEVLNDFTTRFIHTISVVGKQILKEYYSRLNDKSYYLGCSTGGRQGTYSALHYPEDFDGIIAGAPATNFNNLIGALAMMSTYVGAPNGTSSPSFITQDQWGLVNKEVLRQCDALDGLADGVVTEPDNCDFRPESLLCSSGTSNATDCLSLPQVQALKKIYSPLYGLDGELLCPRYSPGAESVYQPGVFGGDIVPFSVGWWRYVVYNDPTFEFTQFGRKDIAAASALDPGQISTFDGHLAAFRERGGKFLTYHGTHDTLIPYTGSKRFYDLVSETLSSPVLDDFYRLFIVPGMNHCAGGSGSYRLGQSNLALPFKNDTTHNMLLALVDWVEGGQGPESFVGAKDDGEERVVCRYPVERNSWDGEKYVCQ